MNSSSRLRARAHSASVEGEIGIGIERRASPLPPTGADEYWNARSRDWWVAQRHR